MRTFFAVITAVVLVTLSCSSANSQSSAESEGTISDHRVEIIRFDKDLLEYITSPSDAKALALETEYKNLLPYFSRVAVGNNKIDLNQLQKYFSHPQLYKLYSETITKFSDLSDVEDELTTASIRAKDILDKKLPAFYVHVSGLKQNVIVADSLISLSLDKYLGRDYGLYAAFFEPYQLTTMSPEYISRDYLKAWILSEFVPENKPKDLLQTMINEGKILYLLDALLPEKKPEILLGYTSNQMQWSTQNERQIWHAIIEKKHLYSTDPYLAARYITDAPYTTTLSPESAPRAGQFIGWRMVDQYMKNTKKTPRELLQETAEEILRISKYNP